MYQTFKTGLFLSYKNVLYWYYLNTKASMWKGAF